MTDETLAAKTNDLDLLVTDMEGAASALAGLSSEEAPAHKAGSHVTNRIWTVADAVNEYLEWYKVHRKSYTEWRSGPGDRHLHGKCQRQQ